MAGGLIYAIGSRESACVKIGSAKRLEARLKVLQTGHPARLRVLAHVEVESDILRIEKRIHAVLAAHRTTGEWFNIPIDLDTLERLIGQARQAIAEDDERVRQARLHQRDGISPLGERVRQARRHRDLTQQALADLVEVDKMTIWRLENGRHAAAKGAMMVNIAQQLGVSVTYLLTGEGTPASSRHAQDMSQRTARVHGKHLRHRVE